MKRASQTNSPLPEGILLVDKPQGNSSFSLVKALRKKLGVSKIGHAGTLDPFATGVMVLLVGRAFTRLSDRLLNQDKEYRAQIRLGLQTDSYDCTGATLSECSRIPLREEVEAAIELFQGEVEQVPPMFSAKKIGGEKLYRLARKGLEVERKPVKVSLKTTLLSYAYPFIEIEVFCSKGTYIRSLAHEIGLQLKTGAHLASLKRTRSGSFTLEQCLSGELLFDSSTDLTPRLLKTAPLPSDKL